MLWSIGGIDAPRAPLRTVDCFTRSDSNRSVMITQKQVGAAGMRSAMGTPCNRIANCGAERVCIIDMPA